MNRDEVLHKLQIIYRDVFDNDSIVLSESTMADDIEGWDSLSYLNLVSEIEEDCNITFTLNEIMNIHNVGEIIDIIVHK